MRPGDSSLVLSLAKDQARLLNKARSLHFEISCSIEGISSGYHLDTMV